MIRGRAGSFWTISHKVIQSGALTSSSLSDSGNFLLIMLYRHVKRINGLKNLVHVIAFPPRAKHACPLCEEGDITRLPPLSRTEFPH